VLSERAGIRGERVMFTSNETPAAEYRYAAKLGAIINLDDRQLPRVFPACPYSRAFIRSHASSLISCR
ncbi:hypothetical protein, partial [Treponema endosymbiont of Eucomonympha sp.]|uniref:hypothetical protein n=1 Tax=Treponema endosymbiont of Eucomonympha sp. TaxID=1580831 RepID=UPI0016505CD9